MCRSFLAGTKSLFRILLLLTVTASVLLYSGASSGGISRGLENVSGLLIPSLFPFMVLSSFLIRSGISAQLGRLLSPVTGCLFSLPGEASAAIIMSFIGGYPVGARCVRLLYEEKKITARQAEQMMLFCICSGPAFLITGVGTILIGNPTAGVILYISQLASGLLLGILVGRIYGREKPTANDTKPLVYEKPGLTDAFILSCSDGAAAMLQLTAMVLFFSMMLSIAEQAGLSGMFCRLFRFIGLDYPEANAAFPIFMEVTAASRIICGSGCSLSVMAFASGFGGICVILQVFSMLGDIPLSRLKILAFRLVNAAVSGFTVYVICLFYRPAAQTFSVAGGVNTELTSTTLAGAAALVLMSVVFVLSLRNERSYIRRTVFKY